MTTNLPRSNRLGVIALAAVYSALTIGAVASPAPAEAKASAPYYVVELAAPASESRAVAAGVAWYCEGTTCSAAKADSRDIRVCRGVQRELGQITSFTSNGEVLPEDKLATCNGN